MSPETPFSPVHSRESFLETLALGEALHRLDDGLGAREPFLLVTGPPGTGKTTLAHEAVARWGERVRAAFLAYPALTAAELLEEIIRRFGAQPPEGGTRPKLLATLEWALAESTGPDQVALLVVDDAHELSAELLHELRLVANSAQQARRPLEVMLVGLPELEARLDDPGLAALRQRVSVRARLEPLSPGETKRYLQHRVTAAGGDGPAVFQRKTCRLVAALTAGVPRQINVLAAESLRRARAAGENAVKPECVQAAAAALWGVTAAPEVRDDADEAADETVTPAPAPVARVEVKSGRTGRVKPAIVPPMPAAPSEAAAPAPAPAATGTGGSRTAAPVTRTPLQAVLAPSGAAPASPAPHPPATSPVPGPGPAVFAPGDDVSAPMPSNMPSHDPREWVARFVGDRGPLQVGSRAAGEGTWVPDPPPPYPAAAVPAPAADPPVSGTDAEPPPEPPIAAPRRPRAAAPARSRTRHGMGVPIGVLAGLVAVAAIVLVIRSSGRARPGAPPGDATLSAASAPESRVAVTPPPRATKKTEAAPSRSRSKRPYTLDVGGWSDLQEALDQRDRMQALTGFEGWVVPAEDGDGRLHRVVLGAYRSEERAQSAADMLIRSRTLRRVTVVPLPPQDARY